MLPSKGSTIKSVSTCLLLSIAFLQLSCSSKKVSNEMEIDIGKSHTKKEIKEEENIKQNTKEKKDLALKPEKKPKNRQKQSTNSEMELKFLRTNRDAIWKVAKSKGLIPGDPHPVVEMLEKLDREIKSKNIKTANKTLIKIQDMLERFKLTEEFLDKKIKRLDKMYKSARLDADKKDVVGLLLFKASDQLMKGRLVDANKTLNRIYKMLRSR